MKKLPTLYKKNSNGKILQWDIYIQDNQFWAEYGQIGGKIQADTPTICFGKNIGKVNETTPEEQAELEAAAKHKKQIEIQNYCESIEQAKTQKIFKPMLAHKYVDHNHKMPDHVMFSAKLDGLRCTISKDGAFSRNGKQWVTTKFIEKDLEEFFKNNPNIILDGEVYNHNFHDNFNKIVSLTKKEKHIDEDDWDEIYERLQFHIFDYYDAANPDITSEQRYQNIVNWEADGYFDTIHFEVVEQIASTKEHLHHHYQQYMERGYEGIMIRNPYSPYETKRSYGLLKYKEFKDEEFLITDITEGSGNRSGMFGRAILEYNGQSFEANSRGDQEYYKELLNNKQNYIGKFATVRYQNETPDGVPRFGVIISVRDYE